MLPSTSRPDVWPGCRVSASRCVLWLIVLRGAAVHGCRAIFNPVLGRLYCPAFRELPAGEDRNITIMMTRLKDLCGFPLPDFWGTALLTAVIETPLFYLLGYRKIRECMCFAFINIVSNLLLNEFLQSVRISSCWRGILLLSEFIVILLEFTLCSCMLPSALGFGGKKLFFSVVMTNASSFLYGLFFY